MLILFRLPGVGGFTRLAWNSGNGAGVSAATGQAASNMGARNRFKNIFFSLLDQDFCLTLPQNAP